MSARDDLDQALMAMASKGDKPRCAWPDMRDWFTSDDPEERARAARRCHSCTVFAECGAVGEDESWGIWAGVDRGLRKPTTTRKRKTT